MNNETLRFAIVGCGRIAQRHAHQAHRVGALVAVCDIDAAKAQALAANYGIPAYTDLHTMLAAAPFDVLVVCTPNGLHCYHAVCGLKAGRHVICEKPMAIRYADTLLMEQAAVAGSKHLFVVKQNRFNPPVAAVKKAMAENRLGNIFSIQLSCFWNRNDDYYADSWRGTAHLDGGTLFTQFSHFIDLLYWMFGDVASVKAFTRNYNHSTTISFEDTGAVLLQFKNGMIGTINYTVNSYAQNMEGSLTIFGQKGTIKIGGQYLNKLEYQRIENYTIDHLPPGNAANDYGQYQGSMSNHDKVYDNVADVILRGGTAATQLPEAQKTVEIIEKIYRAAAEEHALFALATKDDL